MQINHNTTHEVFIPSMDEYFEVNIHMTCNCNEVKAQRDVGIMNDYLELEGVEVDAIYLDNEEIKEPEVCAAILAYVLANREEIETQINEEN